MNRTKLGVIFFLVLAVLSVTLHWWPVIFSTEVTLRKDTVLADTAATKDRALSELLSSADAGFARALKPIAFSFPADHGAHPRFRTEWWYFTGNLNTAEGRAFGYQLTFFRVALSPDPIASPSAWRTNQVYMAHLTLTDAKQQRFYTDERFSRAGNGLAGAATTNYHVWLYDWSAKADPGADFPLRLHAKNADVSLDLSLTTQKKRVLQGNQGLSQKSAEPGNASYYYSYTRLPTTGTLSIAGQAYRVSGTSWMDREWSTSALSKQQRGWDWFSLQLADNTELMVYRLRRKDGRPDPHSAGKLVLADNSTVSLTEQEVVIKTLATWRSPHSQRDYPSHWQLSLPHQALELDIRPVINDQELNVSYRYWEGAVHITGTKNGQPISGQGYVELTGY